MGVGGTRLVDGQGSDAQFSESNLLLTYTHYISLDSIAIELDAIRSLCLRENKTPG